MCGGKYILIFNARKMDTTTNMNIKDHPDYEGLSEADKLELNLFMDYLNECESQ